MPVNYADDVCATFAARVCERLRQAREAGDDAAVARLSAMETVLKTRLVPLISPDAILIAGQAAEAAHRGVAEREWLSLACRERHGEERADLMAAVRLLRAFGFWPWQAQSVADAGAWPVWWPGSTALIAGRG